MLLTSFFTLVCKRVSSKQKGLFTLIWGKVALSSHTKKLFPTKLLKIRGRSRKKTLRYSQLEDEEGVAADECLV